MAKAISCQVVLLLLVVVWMPVGLTSASLATRTSNGGIMIFPPGTVAEMAIITPIGCCCCCCCCKYCIAKVGGGKDGKFIFLPRLRIGGDKPCQMRQVHPKHVIFICQLSNERVRLQKLLRKTLAAFANSSNCFSSSLPHAPTCFPNRSFLGAADSFRTLSSPRHKSAIKSSKSNAPKQLLLLFISLYNSRSSLDYTLLAAAAINPSSPFFLRSLGPSFFSPSAFSCLRDRPSPRLLLLLLLLDYYYYIIIIFLLSSPRRLQCCLCRGLPENVLVFHRRRR